VLGQLSRPGQPLHRETAHQQQQQTPTQQQQSRQQHQTTAQAAAHTTTTTSASTSAEHHHVDINDLDLEELSARLYTRLRSRLRRELLVDRERAGRLTDFR
jgi:TT viral ORF2